MLTNEQKTVFAEKYLRRPDDALMIIASIIGKKACDDDPFALMSLTMSLPNDDFVLSEIDRIKNTPKTKNERIIELENLSNEARKLGDYDAVHKFQRLISEIDGLIGKNSSNDSSNGNGHLEDLAKMVLE